MSSSVSDPSGRPGADGVSSPAAPDFVLEVRIGARRATVHEALCDLHRLEPLHPFIESIEALPASPALPKARRYRVVDRIPLGPFRLKTVYTAALEPVADDEVHGHAWQSPGITLRTIYTLTPGEGEDGGEADTRLAERCFVSAPWGFGGFVRRQARRAHAELLRGLKALLEGETG